MGHALLKKAILLYKMANGRFDLLIDVYIVSFKFDFDKKLNTKHDSSKTLLSF